MTIITKKILVESLSPYTGRFNNLLAAIHLKSLPTKETADFIKFTNSLPEGELTLIQLLRLFILLDNRLDPNLLTSLKNKLELDWRYVLINSLHNQWCQSPYYIRSHKLVAAVDELTPYLSSIGKSYPENVLAITAVLFSLYNIKNDLFLSVFSGILSQSLGNALTANIPNSAFGKSLNAKRIVGWTIGLSIQISLDLMMGTDGTFWMSYIGGTFFQSLTRYTFTKLERYRFVRENNIEKKYPASINFLKIMTEDAAYLMGVLLVNYSKKKPILNPEMPIKKIPQPTSSTVKRNNCFMPRFYDLGECYIPGNKTGTLYVSKDPALSQFEMCEFPVKCPVEGTRQWITTKYYLPSDRRGCWSFIDIRNNQPVGRDRRKYMTTESSKSTATADDPEDIQLSIDREQGIGCYLNLPKDLENTCTVSSKTYYSEDPNLEDNLCKIEINCTTATGKVEQTTTYLPQPMRYCLTFFENCKGKLVVRDENLQLCKESDAAREQAQIAADQAFVKNLGQVRLAKSGH